MNIKQIFFALTLGLPIVAGALDLAPTPMGAVQKGTPLIMLNMERDHKLYYEAYNDASDLNPPKEGEVGDGLEIHYKPTIDYFGYFDSHRCYTYNDGNKKFTPSSITANKQCSGSWSGDFLNYLTMSRMDAMRRVLYGGKRSTDTPNTTVLERSYIPQDAHSWGKEYTSKAVDGYNISDYTPLALPETGTRHLFANTSLLCPFGNSDPGCSTNTAGTPLLRVLTHSNFRVWEWLSIERPVAGVQCATGNNFRTNCVPSGTPPWQVVPSSNFTGLTQATWPKIGSGANCQDHPNDNADFVALEACAKGKTRYGTGVATQISGGGNPFSTATGSQDDYFTLFEGKLVIPAGEGGDYRFAVDGDDAVELTLNGTVIGWYGAHGSDSSPTGLDSHSATINLSPGSYDIKFRHEEQGGGDSYYLYWQKPVSADSKMTDYVVRVDACKPMTVGSETVQEEGCRGYPKDNPTVYKPSGILQEYGEDNRMAFGLITGSYMKNTSGGVLRKNISSFKDEINLNTGEFKYFDVATTHADYSGIVQSIDDLKITGFGGSYSYNANCGVPEVGGTLAEGRCRMWGNPTAEMMYEGLRYFSGATTPTTAFATDSGDDAELKLKAPNWLHPYRDVSSGGYPACSRPYQLVISDINPNFDTDQLPGRHSWPTVTPADATAPTGFTAYKPSTTTNAVLDVGTLGNVIWGGDEDYKGATKNLFIGQSEITQPSGVSRSDGAPTAKNVNSFATIRGLAPEEPTQRGGYYASSVALFGKTHDVNTSVGGNQKVDTFSVALASPLPRMELTVATKKVTLVPFAKTVGGCGSIDITQGQYQPTNTIVDFYVDTDSATYKKFRINFEDSEYGSDHDMDAIAEYELTVNTDGTLSVKVSSNYAAGGCIQHMGYVISGTNNDGVYLVIRDPDTGAGSDPNYYLDKPQHAGSALPTSRTDTFTPGNTTTAAFVEHDPLWYAAKWGGFNDKNNDHELTGNEWDLKGKDNTPDGVPDSYFLVTNAGELKTQLDNAFKEFTAREGASSSAASTASTLDVSSRIYVAKYNNQDWSGQLESYKFVNGQLKDVPEWDASEILGAQSPESRLIITKGKDNKGVTFEYDNLTGPTTTPIGNQTTLLNQIAVGATVVTDNCGPERVAYLRGDSTHESQNGTFKCSTLATGATINNFRPRTVKTINSVDVAVGKLGDISSATPIYVGKPAAGFSDSEHPGYSNFRTNNLSRTPMIYVGANDGMLHGFDASIDTDKNTNMPDSGKEKLAYIPTPVFPNLSLLTSADYIGNHQFYVDAPAMTGDVNLGAIDNAASSDWRSVLVGAMGAGGKGYYALDVSNPTNFTAANAQNILLWEFADDPDMGYAFNRPPTNFTTGQALQIVRLKTSDGSDPGLKWAAVVGNGYNSPNGKAVLYVIFLKEGTDGTWSTGDYVKIVADASATAGYDNGLSTPIVIDSNNDGYPDTAYAGDLKGNLWKFLIGRVDDTAGVAKEGVTNDKNTWKVGFSTSDCGDLNVTKTKSNCSPLFKALRPLDAAPATLVNQPIFWPPEVVQHPIQGHLVYFGTGKFIENTDINNADVQSFYAIWDRGDGTTVTSRNQLLKQEFSTTECADPKSPPAGGCTETVNKVGKFRVSTNNPIIWDPPATRHLGWFMDLAETRERVTGIPKLISNVIFFNTLIPSNVECELATGYLMALNYENGGLVQTPIFNTNGDTKFDKATDFNAAGFNIGAVIGGSIFVRHSDETVGTSGATGSGTSSSDCKDGEICKKRSPCDLTAINNTQDGTIGTTDLQVCQNLGRLNWREIVPK